MRVSDRLPEVLDQKFWFQFCLCWCMPISHCQAVLACGTLLLLFLLLSYCSFYCSTALIGNEISMIRILASQCEPLTAICWSSATFRNYTTFRISFGWNYETVFNKRCVHREQYNVRLCECLGKFVVSTEMSDAGWRNYLNRRSS